MFRYQNDIFREFINDKESLSQTRISSAGSLKYMQDLRPVTVHKMCGIDFSLKL